MDFYTKKKPVIIWLFLMTFINISGCESEKHIITSESTKGTPRIITLSPHLAELVNSAGAINNLVGVVAYSDFPERVKTITQVGDAFKLDYEKILQLKPTHVITWKTGTPVAIVDKLKQLDLNVVETEILNLEDIPKTIKQISKITHSSEVALQNIKDFHLTLSQLKNRNTSNKTVFIETYHQPLYTVSRDHWMSQAAMICGYENIFTELEQLSAPITVESVISKNPQVILNIATQEDNQWHSWVNLEAVKNKQIITIHPDIFSRPSLRILKGINQLCGY